MPSTLMSPGEAAQRFLASLGEYRRAQIERLSRILADFAAAGYRQALEVAKAEYVLRHANREADGFLAAMDRRARESTQ